ncbi:hypothetical protein [Streptomyces sp. NPDC012508]|uniref:hypothetical protein n=1 Tax=Streptomyces sp. NPDC012508 TaxID=3364837 RepID=UPI003681DE7C
MEGEPEPGGPEGRETTAAADEGASWEEPETSSAPAFTAPSGTAPRGTSVRGAAAFGTTVVDFVPFWTRYFSISRPRKS